jgi:uncharacterized protein YqeY
MASLKERLHADLTAAIRSSDEVTRETLRMALAAVTNEEVSGKAARELSDDEVVLVLTKEAKKRKEAVEAFTQAGREDRANAEAAELTVLERYLPTPLSDAEVDAIIATAVQAAAATGAEGGRAMGLVMKSVTPQISGRYDGAAAAAKVRAALGMN